MNRGGYLFLDLFLIRYKKEDANYTLKSAKCTNGIDITVVI